MNRSYLVLVLAAIPAMVQAQFNSGSTGSDGALNLTTAGTITLDPTTLPNQCANNVCNFTSVNIGASTTVLLTNALWRNAPVVWLAQGTVTISGALRADGQNGATMSVSNPGLNRFPAAPGPGGFPGGVGGYLGQAAQPGAGFGGGVGGTSSSPSGGFGVYSYYNNQLTPLRGGSGGGGGYVGTATAGGNGGGGGGGLRIVSSASITVNGTVSANAGFPTASVPAGGGGGGYGSGGVVHLVAPSVSGTGNLQAAQGNNGYVEISATTNTYTGGIAANFVSAGLYNPPLPSVIPAVQVTSVNGVAAPTYPSANPMVPDVTINSASPVSIVIAAQNIPTTTTVTLHLTSENGPDTSVTCGALSGSVASSTATCTGANFPSGVTITNILAVW